jgi:N-acyl-D-amino-acid deacylase
MFCSNAIRLHKIFWVLAATLINSALAAPTSPTAPAARHFDLLIRNGDVIDGSGKTRFTADIGVKGDQIVALGKLPHATASRIIDARQRLVVPGFIDLHAHLVDGDNGSNGLLSPDLKRRAAQNYVAQGVTTAVTNPDGFQTQPLRELAIELQRLGFGVNVVLLNGHSGLREIAMRGDTARAANAAEIREMQAVLRADLEQHHSFGLSLGIEYEPARYASLEEQLALAQVVGEYNGIFIPHLRSQGIAPMWYQPSRYKNQSPPNLDQAIMENLTVAEQTNATVVFTHMKAWGPGYRGEAARLIKQLSEARARGARVFMDVYPYDSSGSDGQFIALPSWVFDTEESTSSSDKAFDYRAALEDKLQTASKEQLADLVADVKHQIALKGGPQNVRLLEYPKKSYVGKTYAELMQEHRLDETALAIALQREGDPLLPGGARMRSFSMAQEDIEQFYKLDWCAVSTDGWIVLPEEAVGEKKYLDTNRRCFGSYPRRLAYFSIEKETDSLEHAVRAASGLPAEILNLTDRGQLKVGMKADIVVLNLAELRDNTTYLEPSVYPSGVEYVWVNGKLAVDNGKRTLALSGKILSPAHR